MSTPFRSLLAVSLLTLVFVPTGSQAQVATPPAAPPQLTPQQLEIQRLSIEDRQRMMDLLHITTLRMGPNSRDEVQPGRFGLVNYDESKANPYPNLPDPLVLKNGKKVTSAKMWWDQRRPEIVEDFDREDLRPHAKSDTQGEVGGGQRRRTRMNGDVPVITKQLSATWTIPRTRRSPWTSS